MTPSPSEVFDLTVALDYGQFSLISLPADDHFDLAVPLVQAAIKGEGVASSEGNEVVVVLSPHQNNFTMGLRIELWAAEPPDDLDDWQEAFLTGLVVGEGGLAYESPTVAFERLAVPPGRYAARISGRGFVQRAGPDRPSPVTPGGCSCGRRPS